MSEQQAEAPQTGLTGKAARGGAWVLGLKIFVQVAMSIKLLLMARALGPADFGLMGVALLAISMFEAFSATGFNVALVRRTGDIEGYLDTAWTISFLRGLGLALVMFLTAPLLAIFFKSPEAASIIRAVSVVFVFRGLTNPATVYFQRNMDFKKTFVLGLAEAVFDITFSLLALTVTRTAWALVIGFTAGSLAKEALSYVLYPRRPRFVIDKEKANDLSSYGRWVWANNIFVFLGSELDSFMVGGLLGTTALGLYQMANRIAVYLTREISEMISQVVYPVYSRLQDEREKLVRSYLYSVRLTFGIIFPLAMVMVFFGSEVVSAVLGEKWLPAVPAIRFLVLAGVFRGLTSLGTWLFFAVGAPNKNSLVTGLRTVVLFALFIPLCLRYRIAGAALAVMCANAVMLVPLLYFMPRLAGVSRMQYFRAIALPLVVGLLVVGVPYILWSLVEPPKERAWLILVSLAVSGLVYACYMVYAERRTVGRIASGLVRG